MNEYNFNGHKCRTTYNRDGEKYARATPATLDEAGESLLTSAKASIAKYDPDGTSLKIAFISDLHRSEEGIYSSNAIDDRYSMRLLSRLCDDVDIDAIFCGGDITNGRDENADYVAKNMGDVVDDFDDLMPYTSIYSNVGNHDKRYSTSRTLNTNEWIGELWDQVCGDGNAIEYHSIDDTNFYVDFRKHKLRIIFINQYDDVDSNASWYANENISSATGIHTHGTTKWKEAIPTTDKAEWIIGAVIHGADNSVPTNPSIRYWTFTDLSNTLKEYVDNGGKGVLGIFAGHYHITQGISLNAFNSANPAIPVCHVNAALAKASQFETTNAYCFSVFVIDPKTWVFHEIRIGRSEKEVPFRAYFGNNTNNGLLMNGTLAMSTGWNENACIYNGNHVRIDERWRTNGLNLTNLPKNWGIVSGDYTTSDTDNVLFSASAGDIIKTEVIFENSTKPTVSNWTFKIFSPQIANMVAGDFGPNVKLTNEITLTEDTDVTAIGMYLYGGIVTDTYDWLGFELNIYKNGVKLTR